jgi:hypothetical protein
MGAALTYARRYALFTLVGIAGEDDLDAPDLNCQTAGEAGSALSDRASASPSARPAGHAKGRRQGRPVLGPEASAETRDRLIREMVKLPSEESAGEWARNVLPVKNTLTSRDARLVETAFAFRIPALQENSPEPGPRASTLGDAVTVESGNERVDSEVQGRSRGRIDKSVLALGEARRIRDKEHLKYVASRPCLICGRLPSEPHHVRFAQKLAFGRKVSDEFTVPLCRLHHRELHRSRNEPLWWKTARIDALPIARELWEATRPKATPRPVSGTSGPASSVLPALSPPTDEVPEEVAAEKRQAAREAAAESKGP